MVTKVKRPVLKVTKSDAMRANKAVKRLLIEQAIKDIRKGVYNF